MVTMLDDPMCIEMHALIIANLLISTAHDHEQLTTTTGICNGDSFLFTRSVLCKKT